MVAEINSSIGLQESTDRSEVISDLPHISGNTEVREHRSGKRQRRCSVSGGIKGIDGGHILGSGYERDRSLAHSSDYESDHTFQREPQRGFSIPWNFVFLSWGQPNSLL